MMRTKTNEQLATLLEQQQVDRTLLNEVAQRLRRIDLDQLLISAETVEAVHNSPIIDAEVAKKVEGLILAVSVNARRQSSSRLSGLAGRILQGAEYQHSDVLSLAASVLSQDETRGQ